MATTKTKKKTGDVVVTIAHFDSQEPFVVIRDGKIAEHKEITATDYQPRGGTPLRDATAEFIGHLDKQQKANPDGVTIGLLLDRSGSMGHLRETVIAGTNEFVNGMKDTEADDDAAGKVLAIVFTDGYENASREVTAEALRELTDEREKAGWTFIYMGANQDAWGAGRAMGLSGGMRGQTVSYAGTAQGTASAMSAMTNDAVGYVGQNASYMKSRRLSGSRSILEDGTETTENTGAALNIDTPLTSGPAVPSEADIAKAKGYDVAEALKKAKGETEEE